MGNFVRSSPHSPSLYITPWPPTQCTTTMKKLGKRNLQSRFFSSMLKQQSIRVELPPAAMLPMQNAPAEVAPLNACPKYLSTIFARPVSEHLPLDIPETSMLSNVGGTPITEINPGVWAKLEGFNFSGTIKDRAALHGAQDVRAGHPA